MFTYLYDSIFPYLGEFFGKLIAVASLPVSRMHNLFSGLVGSLYIEYKNLFTGISTSFTLHSYGTFFNTVFDAILNIVFAGVPWESPLWVALLLACVEVFIIASFVRFVKAVL